MTIVLIVEGDTEVALKRHLKDFLDKRARSEGKAHVRLETRSGINTKPDKLKRRVQLELKKPGVTAVIGLIDVFPDFESATEAKAHLTKAAGNNPDFYAHTAQYDVEAWLLPFWDAICKRIGVKQSPPGAKPEMVNNIKPPSYRLRDLYQRAKPKPRKYVKATEMFAILQGKDLMIVANQCSEFKELLNTLFRLSNLSLLP